MDEMTVREAVVKHCNECWTKEHGTMAYFLCRRIKCPLVDLTPDSTDEEYRTALREYRERCPVYAEYGDCLMCRVCSLIDKLEGL